MTTEPAWRAELKDFLRTPADLLKAGLICVDEASAIAGIGQRYQIAISPYYSALIDRDDTGRANPQCPIFRQAVPVKGENLQRDGFSDDPLEDARHLVAPRLTYRLCGRALLHVTASCSTYCRFCFRKTLLNDSVDELFSGGYAKAIQYLHNEPEINEIILTGGDPLMLGDDALATLIAELAKVPHLSRLRVHTRVPVTFPSRVTDALVTALDGDFDQRVIVTHYNHPRELTHQAIDSCKRLMTSGIMVWNQSVLLKGVNDCSNTLVTLFSNLHLAGIRNYYLHHPDKSEGTAHFWLSLEEGHALFQRAAANLSPQSRPRYVVDTLGESGKTLVEDVLGGVTGSHRVGAFPTAAPFVAHAAGKAPALDSGIRNCRPPTRMGCLSREGRSL